MASNTLVQRDLSLTNLAVTNTTSRNMTSLLTKTTILDASELVATSIIANSITSNDITTDTLDATDGTIQNLNATDVATFDQGLIITSTGKITPTVPLNYFNSKDFLNATVSFGGGTTTTNFYFRRVADMVFVYFDKINLIAANNTLPGTTTNLTFADSSFASNVLFSFLSPVHVINNTVTNGTGLILLSWSTPTLVSIFIFPTATLADNWNVGETSPGFLSYRIS